MEATWKTITRWIILAVGAFLALIVAAVLVLQLPPVKQTLLDEITTRTNDQLAGEMRAESLRGPILWRLTLDDVQLRDAQGTPVAHVDKLRVGYSLLELLTGEVEVNRVGLVRPLLLVRAYPEASYNIFDVTGPGSPTEDRYTISSLWIEDGVMIYEDRTGDGGEAGTVTERQQKVGEWIEEAFASGGEFDTAPVREWLAPEAGDGEGTEEPGDIALADAVEMEGGLVLGPGGHQRLTVDDVSTTIFRPTFANPLPIVGEEMTFDLQTDQWQIDVSEMQLAESSTLESLEVDIVPVSDEEAEARPEDAPFFREIAGSIEAFEVTPELVGVFVPDPPIAVPLELQATFEGPPEAIDVSGNGSVQDGGAVTVDGTVDWTVPSYNISLEFEGVELMRWMDADGPTVVFDAAGSVTGEGVSFDEHLRADIDLTGSDITIGEWRADRFEIDAGVRGRRLELSGLTMQAPLFEAVAEGYRTPDGDIVLSSVVETADREAAARLADALGLDRRLLGRAELAVDLNPGASFELGAQLIPTLLPQFPFFVRTGGEYSDDFRTYTLSSAMMGRPGWEWHLRDQARLAIRDEQLEIASMVLERKGKTARLDGTYDLEGGESWPELFDKLAPRPLEMLFDVNVLRERLPDDVDERIPDDIQDRVPEELEKRVPDDLRDLFRQ